MFLASACGQSLRRVCFSLCARALLPWMVSRCAMGIATAFPAKDDGGSFMIGRTNKQLKMRVLMVDDDLGSPNSMRGRVLTELVEEFHNRNTELVKATSYEDGLAAITSDAALHCICVDWTLGKNDDVSHAQALELLRSIRQRNENVPVFL